MSRQKDLEIVDLQRQLSELRDKCDLARIKLSVLCNLIEQDKIELDTVKESITNVCLDLYRGEKLWKQAKPDQQG